MIRIAHQVRPSPREAGFTLIELLVSLTILAVILGLASAALRVIAKDWEANTARIETLDMVARAGDILRRDVAGLQRIVAGSGQAAGYVFHGTEMNLSFVTLEPPYPSAAGAYFVDYSVVPNGPGADLIRARARYQREDGTFPGATPANRVPLVQGRYRYHFSYADKTSKAAEWRPTWSNPTRLPTLIRLQLFDLAHDTPLAPPFVVAVKADAELSCLDEKANLCSARTGGDLRRQPERADTEPKNGEAQ
jgi:general secretion pathway protein J